MTFLATYDELPSAKVVRLRFNSPFKITLAKGKEEIKLKKAPFNKNIMNLCRRPTSFHSRAHSYYADPTQLLNLVTKQKQMSVKSNEYNNYYKENIFFTDSTAPSSSRHVEKFTSTLNKEVILSPKIATNGFSTYRDSRRSETPLLYNKSKNDGFLSESIVENLGLLYNNDILNFKANKLINTIRSTPATNRNKVKVYHVENIRHIKEKERPLTHRPLHNSITNIEIPKTQEKSKERVIRIRQQSATKQIIIQPEEANPNKSMAI